VTEGTSEQGRGVGGLSRRAVVWLTWSLWALAFALTTLSLVLLVLNLSHPGTHVFDWWFVNALVVIDATVGAIVATYRPDNPVGWLLCLSGVSVSTSSFTSQYAIYALLARPGSLPAGEALAWIAAWQLPVIIGLQVSYLLLFPTGRLPSGRWRWLAGLIVTFVVVGVVLSAFSPDAYLGSLDPIRNPLGIESFTYFWKALLYTVAPLLYVAVALSVFVRMRRAVGVERQQIKWFAYAAAIFAMATILNVTTLEIDAPRWVEWANLVIFSVAGTTIPIAIGIAILRYRLYDIDLLINRTLVYGSLTATLVAAYFAGIGVSQRLFVVLTGERSALADVASTLLIAALFSPVRRRVQGFVDRRFYRRKYDAVKTLEGFSAKLRDETDLEALNDDLVGVVRETVQPAYASLWLRSPTEAGRGGESSG
jgi:hypothetical protein